MSRFHSGTSSIRLLILFSQPWQYGGAETHLHSLVMSLRRQGIEIVLVGIDDDIVLRFGDEGIPVYKLPLRSKSPVVHYNNYQCLEKIVKKHKINIIHAHHRTGSLYGWLLNRCLSVPYVVTFHDKWRQLHKLYKPFLPQTCIAVSSGIKRHFVDVFKVAPKKIEVVGNGINVKEFSLGRLCFGEPSFSNNPLDEDTILSVTRFSRHKCVVPFLLCQMAERLNHNFPQLKIILVGQGPKYEEIKAAAYKANEACGREVVLFLGPRPDIPQLLAKSTIAVGAGRFVLEAMAAGRPVIAAADGKNYPGIITDKNWLGASKTSWTRGEKELVEDNLLEDIETLLSDRQRLDEISRFCRELVTSRFSSEQMAEHIKKIYERELK